MSRIFLWEKKFDSSRFNGRITFKEELKYRPRRLKMVEGLMNRGIKDWAVLSAMAYVPRHLFISSSFAEFAYQDRTLPILSLQTISQPYTVARQTELLDIKPSDKVLEVGTGSGYQSAVLAMLSDDVYSIERQNVLYQQVSQLFRSLEIKVNLFYGDGFDGLPLQAPFDKIIITARASEVPNELLAQLRVGGLMSIPYGNYLYIVRRKGEKDYEWLNFGECDFVPMLRGINN